MTSVSKSNSSSSLDTRVPIGTPPVDQSGRLFQQIASDLQQYEVKTRTFFKSLIPRKRDTNEDQGGDAESNSLDADEHDDSVSDDSQNLRGFESTVDDQDEEDDGEECSSSSHSDIFRSYRNERLAMILNGGGGRDSNAVAMSSDGEGMHPVRSRSTDSRPRGRASSRLSTSSKMKAVPSNQVVVDPAQAREQARIEALELVLKELRSTKTLNGAPAMEKTTPVASSPSRTRRSSVHYESLDRQRLRAVLRVSKNDQTRAVNLSTKYSELLDRLGLQHTCADDVQEFARCQALQLMKGSDGVTKDGSMLLFIDVRRLPPVPSSSEAAKRQFAVNLIRYVLFLLEEARFEQEHSSPVSSAMFHTMTTGEGSPIRVHPAPQAQPAASTSTPTHAVKKSYHRTTKESLRSVGGVTQIRGDAITLLADVTGCETSVLSALSVVLAQGEELLCQSYPVQVVRVIVFSGSQSISSTIGARHGKGRHFDVGAVGSACGEKEVPPIEAEPSQAASATAVVGARNAKRGPVSMITSLFKSNDSRKKNETEKGTNPAKGEASSSNGGSLATKMWLSVMVSTWKLRYLHHTVRSRTVFTDNIDPFVNMNELKAIVAEKVAVAPAAPAVKAS